MSLSKSDYTKVNNLIKVTSKVCGVGKDRILSSSSKNKIVLCRKIIMVILMNLHKWPLSKIASALNKKCHSTILHHKRKHDDDYAQNFLRYKEHFDSILNIYLKEHFKEEHLNENKYMIKRALDSVSAQIDKIKNMIEENE